MKFRSTLNLHSGLLEVPDLFWKMQIKKNAIKALLPVWILERG